MTRTIITVFGGSGFLGRHLIQRLAAQGHNVRAAGRDVEAAAFLRVMGDAGQVVPWPCDVKDMQSVRAAVKGASIVVNAIGILSEWGKQSFTRVHVEGATNVAQASADAGIDRLVHISALGADAESESDYARTKAEGEIAVRDIFPDAIIMRPSVVFGPEDGFFNMFAGLCRFTPALPVIGAPIIPEIRLGGEHGVEINLYGKGGPRFQPVYVGDVADAIVAALADPGATAKTYELVGPTVYSFKELMELVLAVTSRKRLLMPLCYTAAELVGFFAGLLPKPLLTRDQVALMKTDNVASGALPGLSDLGIQVHTAEAILPTYLHRFRTPVHRHAV